MSEEPDRMRRLDVIFKSKEWDDLEYLRYMGKLGSLSETVRACVRICANEARKHHSIKED